MIMNMNNDNEQRVTPTNWMKFRLLLWKNWTIQWNQKRQLILVILFPVLFMLLVVLIRWTIEPVKKNETYYNVQSIDNLEVYVEYMKQDSENLDDKGSLKNHILLFTPKNDINLKIIEATVLKLGLNGSRAYDTAKKMEHALIEKNFFAGVEFVATNKRKDGFPLVFNIALRFPSALRTFDGEDGATWATSNLFPDKDELGPRNVESDTGGPGYLTEGFLPLQHTLTMAWLKLGSNTDETPVIEMQRFPYKAYNYDSMIETSRTILPLMIVLSFIYPFILVTKYVAEEKELQLKEVMKMQGLHNWLHWAAWFVKSYLVIIFVVLILICILKIRIISGAAILTNSNFLVLLIVFHTYVVMSICLCFVLATFFSKATTAAAACGILHFVTFLPYAYAADQYNRFTFVSKILLCLIPNTGIGFALHIIMDWETTGDGVTLSNMFEAVSADDSLSLIYIILTMTLGAIIYMAICLYVEQIYPGKYGVPRRWNFPCHREFWKSLLAIPIHRATNSSQDFPDFSTNEQFASRYEPNTINNEMIVGVQIEDLKKKFGNRTVVKELNLHMYRNEITVLLGHNGAGKTTTIMMLTGILAPTSGKAYIDGYDITTELDKARQSMGICPQHNVLFNHMSLRNHIIFFCNVKGVRDKELVEQEISKYIMIMELEGKENVLPTSLSGGMKRKLALCCALCGRSKTVLCDEPTSGVDTAARRRLWDLLQEEKEGRTLLLTTHYMDEADVLGDRIAIMCDGQIQCYGTSFYLKKRYGSGYHLICVKKPGCKVEKVTALLDKHIPGIQPDKEIGSELSYCLPHDYIREYADMFEELEKHSDQLQIDEYGVNVDNLEEVFINAGIEYKHQQRSEAGQERVNVKKVKEEHIRSIRRTRLFDENRLETSESKCYIMQWRALFNKKVLIARRNYWILLAQILLPVVLVIITLLGSGGRKYYNQPAMQISLKQYSGAYVVLHQQSNDRALQKLGQAYADYVHSHGSAYKLLNTRGEQFEKYILKTVKDKQSKIDSRYMAGATIGDSSFIVWLNNKPLHTAPLTLNLMHNALAKQLLAKNAQTSVINKPVPHSKLTLKFDSIEAKNSQAGDLILVMSITMSFVSALYIVPLIKERKNRAKLLQYLSGVSSIVYSSTHLIIDYMIFIVMALLTILAIEVFSEARFVAFEVLVRILIIFLIFGLATILLMYILSFGFSDAAMGFIFSAIILILLGAGLIFVYITLKDVPDAKQVNNNLDWIFHISPIYCFLKGVYNLLYGYFLREYCEGNSEQSGMEYCKNIAKYFAWEDPGVLPEIVFLLVSIICYVLLLLLLDSGSTITSRLQKKLTYCFRRQNREEGGVEQSLIRINDNGVIRAQEFIDTITEEQRRQLPLVVDRISKRYRKFLAVNELSFYVEKGECFGLLGVNGAGKTTTFKMLTGDLLISSGVAYVSGINLRTHIKKVYSRIGYCPQFDALFNELTGREILRIYCMLRGVQRRYINELSLELAMAYNFLPHVDKLSQHYSGGNKRKLSAAVATIGNPSVIYLDEPTTGMDPYTRRQLWNVLLHIRDLGKSLVLTTHGMEDCEALCTRLGIMVNGEFVCMGSSQELKNRYSKGFVLKMKVTMLKKIRNDNDASGSSQKKERQTQDTTKRESQPMEKNNENTTRESRASRDTGGFPNEVDSILKVKKFVDKKIPCATLQEEYHTQLTYYIPKQSMKCSQLFRLIEGSREGLQIEDYTISQTTLQEIFLNFAHGDQNEIEATSLCQCVCLKEDQSQL